MYTVSDSTLPHRADYVRAIYEALLRIEDLLRDSRPAPDRAPRIFGKAALSMRETSETLGIGLSTLKELVRTNRIPSVRIGKRRIIPAASLESFLRDQP